MKAQGSRPLSIAVALLALVALPSYGHANLVQNGDFAGCSGFAPANTCSPWVFTPAASGSYFFYNGVPGEGAVFAGLTTGSYDSISQTIATTPGDSYTISFDLTLGGGGNQGFIADFGTSQ